MSEKQELLKQLEKNIVLKNFSIELIKKIILIFILVFALMIPKLYISNQIYLLSVKINKLNKEYLSLKAENKILKTKIENLRFKNNIKNYSYDGFF